MVYIRFWPMPDFIKSRLNAVMNFLSVCCVSQKDGFRHPINCFTQTYFFSPLPHSLRNRLNSLSVSDTRKCEKKKDPTPFIEHIWCCLTDALKKKKHRCFFMATGTIMSFLTAQQKTLKSFGTSEVLIQTQSDR